MASCSEAPHSEWNTQVERLLRKTLLHHINVVFHWDCNTILLQFSPCRPAKSLLWNTPTPCWNKGVHEICTMHTKKDVLASTSPKSGMWFFFFFYSSILLPLILWKWLIREDCDVVRKRKRRSQMKDLRRGRDSERLFYCHSKLPILYLSNISYIRTMCRLHSFVVERCSNDWQ